MSNNAGCRHSASFATIKQNNTEGESRKFYDTTQLHTHINQQQRAISYRAGTRKVRHPTIVTTTRSSNSKPELHSLKKRWICHDHGQRGPILLGVNGHVYHSAVNPQKKVQRRAAVFQKHNAQVTWDWMPREAACSIINRDRQAPTNYDSSIYCSVTGSWATSNACLTPLHMTPSQQRVEQRMATTADAKASHCVTFLELLRREEQE